MRGSPRLCGVLYDSIVALMAPLCERVGGAAHGKRVRARQRTLSTYTIHRTRPANYISRDRADFANTEHGPRGIRTRATYRRPQRYTRGVIGRGVVRAAAAPYHLFGHFLFIGPVTFV